MERKTPRVRSEPGRSRTAPKSNPVPGRSNQRTDAPAEAKRRAMIAERAYYRAERRGFAPGHEVEDWLAAETEVDLILASVEPREGAARGPAH
jgi:hypothetical protein